jgi:type III restriction enzyme
MRAYWVPGVNNLKRYGRWEFAEFRSIHGMKDDFDRLVEDLAAKAGAPAVAA